MSAAAGSIAALASRRCQEALVSYPGNNLILDRGWLIDSSAPHMWYRRYESTHGQFEVVHDKVHGIVSLGLVHDKVLGVVLGFWLNSCVNFAENYIAANYIVNVVVNYVGRRLAESQ